MYSFSKSLTSTAIGFAVQEGILSLDDKLVDLVPAESLPAEISENLAAVTIHDLLIMGGGHESEPIPMSTLDWKERFLAHPFVYQPGTMFQYNTMGTHMCDVALKTRTGVGLVEFLRPRLLNPLGISEVEIVTMPDGTEMGGAGFFLRTEDMARFITFIANRGVWQGERLLEDSWFDRATEKQIETANDIYMGKDPDWQQGYCYQYWICQPEGVVRADGLYGQFGIIFKKQDAVLIITERTTKTQDVLQAVWDFLLPAMADGELAADEAECGKLRERLAHAEHGFASADRVPGAAYWELTYKK